MGGKTQLVQEEMASWPRLFRLTICYDLGMETFLGPMLYCKHF